MPALSGADAASPTVALDTIVTGADAGNGVHWTLDESADLNVNLAHLDPGAAVAAHTNHEIDVVLIVTAGHGRLRLDGIEHPLDRHTLALAPKGAERSIEAGPEGLTYLTVHRRRAPLAIRPGAPRGTRGPRG